MKKRFTASLLLLFTLLSLFSCVSDTAKETAGGTEESVSDVMNYETIGSIDVNTDKTDITDTNFSETTVIPDNSTTSNVTQGTTADTKKEEKPNNNGKRISVLCAGDNIIHEAVFTYANTLAGGDGYDFEPIYRDILPLVKAADIAFINQESPICGDELGISGYPRFNAPEALGDFLIDAGFDVIALANNHMFDKYQKGYEGMLSYWKDKDVLTVGAYEDRDDYNDIRILEQDGVKIAFLAYTDFINNKAYTEYDPDEATIPFTDHSVIRSQVKAAKEMADFVIVSMHWGEEDEFDVTREQEKCAEIIAEAGADVIIGHHPHVVGKIEWLNNGKTLCMYSLGNLMSTMYYARNLTGTMVSFDIVCDGDDFEVENVKCIPTVTYYEYPENDKSDANRTDIKLYLLEDFTEELAESHGSNEKESSPITLKRLKKYITDNIESEFLN